VQPFGVACTWLHTYTFEATGSGLFDPLPGLIALQGTRSESHIKFDCTDEWAHLAGGDPPQTRNHVMNLTVTEQGIAGQWQTLGVSDFLLPAD
jgi:hypothetical protein